MAHGAMYLCTSFYKEKTYIQKYHFSHITCFTYKEFVGKYEVQRYIPEMTTVKVCEKFFVTCAGVYTLKCRSQKKGPGQKDSPESIL